MKGKTYWIITGSNTPTQAQCTDIVNEGRTYLFGQFMARYASECFDTKESAQDFIDLKKDRALQH